MGPTKRVALYLRVSSGSQTVENQREELRRWAAYRGFEIVGEYADEGVSGAKGPDKRAGLDALLTAATRRQLDMVACWSLCRLGRNMLHLVQIGETFRQLGVALYAHRDGIDTSTTAGELVYHVMGALAQFERDRLRERTVAGLERARAQGKRLGRPRVPNHLATRAERLLLAGYSRKKVRRELQLGGSVVDRIHHAMLEAGTYAPATTG